MKKRKIDLAVISDVHLGTIACHADELIAYLSSIQPKKLILNGDIMDFQQFNNRYFPPAHLNVLRKIMGMAAKGTEVYYITGNNDELLRKLSETAIGNISIVDKLTLQLDGKTAWFFHGDVFDTTFQNAKWLTKLGSHGYSFLLFLNRQFKWMLHKLGFKRNSISNQIRLEAPNAQQKISAFEKCVVNIAIDNHYDYVICGHTHQPKKEIHMNKKGKCTYLNSGDWVKSLTALEYSFKRWKLYTYNLDKLSPFFADEELKELDIHEIVASITAKKELENSTKKRTSSQPHGDAESID